MPSSIYLPHIMHFVSTFPSSRSASSMLDFCSALYMISVAFNLSPPFAYKFIVFNTFPFNPTSPALQSRLVLFSCPKSQPHLYDSSCQRQSCVISPVCASDHRLE